MLRSDDAKQNVYTDKDICICRYSMSGLSRGTPCPECGEIDKFYIAPFKKFWNARTSNEKLWRALFIIESIPIVLFILAIPIAPMLDEYQVEFLIITWLYVMLPISLFALLLNLIWLTTGKTAVAKYNMGCLFIPFTVVIAPIILLFYALWLAGGWG